jgi:hypothetical protein
MKLNIPKITEASYQNMINAYKKISIKMIPTFSHMASGPKIIYACNIYT